MPNQQNKNKSQQGSAPSIKKVLVRTLSSDVASIRNQGGGRPKSHEFEGGGASGGVGDSSKKASESAAPAPPPPPPASGSEAAKGAQRQPSTGAQNTNPSFMNVWGGTIKVTALVLTALALMAGIYFFFFQ